MSKYNGLANRRACYLWHTENPLKENHICQASMPLISEKDFKSRLNPEQYRAVTHIEGPVLVIAGAGSGKTRTLVYRVARLIMEGIPPESILLLTFTRKAASGMLQRASEITGPACSQVAGGTFHSFAHRMLRSHAHLAGYSPNFTIMDAGDTRDLLHLLAREMKFTGPGKRFPRKATLAAIISKAENASKPIEDIIQRYYPHLSRDIKSITMLHQAYTRYKKKHGLMDYDDLLLRWRDILLDSPRVRQEMGERYQFIMVDEYQDTNPAQAEIVRLMATGHENVMVVGDDAQSIYSFRGATINNILDFPHLFPGTTIIKLEKNYRSTQPNLDCTNAIIANASQKFSKRLTAHRTGGVPPALYQARDENEQAAFVAGHIASLIDNGTEPHEIAALFRAGFHSFALETELNARGIPFEKRGGMRLIESAHIKDFISVLRISQNPLDRLSLERALLLIPHLGIKTAGKIFAEVVKSSDPHRLLAEYPSRARWAEKLQELGKLLLEINHLASHGKFRKILDMAEKWYRPFLQANYIDDFPKRQQDISQLIAMSSKYGTIQEMLDELALDPPEKGPDDSSNRKRVVLSTIHSAKGLEWKAVYILSMAEGRFPSPASQNSIDELEEERRLFYVAATRAKDYLCLCYPMFINMAGAGLAPAEPCRFLKEIPPSLLHQIDPATHPLHTHAEQGFEACTKTPAVTSKNFSQGSGGLGPDQQGDIPLAPGTRVRHSTFGRGKIIQKISTEKVKVLFEVGGIKTLHLKYAKLCVI